MAKATQPATCPSIEKLTVVPDLAPSRTALARVTSSGMSETRAYEAIRPASIFVQCQGNVSRTDSRSPIIDTPGRAQRCAG